MEPGDFACVVCGGPIGAGRPHNARTCSPACQRVHRAAVSAAANAARKAERAAYMKSYRARRLADDPDYDRARRRREAERLAADPAKMEAHRARRRAQSNEQYARDSRAEGFQTGRMLRRRSRQRDDALTEIAAAGWSLADKLETET